MLLFIVHKLAVTIQVMLGFTGRAEPGKNIADSRLYKAVFFFLLIPFSEGEHIAMLGKDL